MLSRDEDGSGFKQAFFKSPSGQLLVARYFELNEAFAAAS